MLFIHQLNIFGHLGGRQNISATYGWRRQCGDAAREVVVAVGRFSSDRTWKLCWVRCQMNGDFAFCILPTECVLLQ